MSEAALCQADVAEDLATHLDKWQLKPLRASFDCALDQNTARDDDLRRHRAWPCRHRSLSQLHQLPKECKRRLERAALVADEREWLRALPAKCGLSVLPASQKTINCLRNQFEIRFTLLDSCARP